MTTDSSVYYKQKVSLSSSFKDFARGVDSKCIFAVQYHIPYNNIKYINF